MVDKYRYWKLEAIVEDLDRQRNPFHVAIENWQHDLNIGSVVRTANAFLASEVHIVGNRKWNRRGAMVTDRYQHVRHQPALADLATYAAERSLPVIGIDNLPGAVPLETYDLPRECVLLFGQEGPGLTDDAHADLYVGALHRSVRLDPLDQRECGGRDRDARLDPPAHVRSAVEQLIEDPRRQLEYCALGGIEALADRFGEPVIRALHVFLEQLPPAIGQLDRVPAPVVRVLLPRDELLLLETRQNPRQRLRLHPLGRGDLARRQRPASMQLPKHCDPGAP